LRLHQQASNQLRRNNFYRAAEEGFVEGWEVLEGGGGYGNG
jgi:hypothetical protein